jgi:hypothetical protein
VLLTNFFMALMFFISGLFVWQSLTQKGAAAFLMERWRRLGIPFALSLAVIMPVAYYPAFLRTGAEEDVLSYWVGWSWNSGPAWFLSMLFGFDLLLAICFHVMGQTRRAVPEALVTQPPAFFLALVILSSLGFMPLMAVYGPFRWLEWGPFIIGQASRPALYAVYFVAGVVVGSPVGSLEGRAVVGSDEGELEGVIDGAGTGSEVGEGKGTRVGSLEGSAEGAKVGTTEGACEGACVGCLVGLDEGFDDGVSVGTGVGASVGDSVGTLVGTCVGNAVGTDDGSNVGEDDGIDVGV